MIPKKLLISVLFVLILFLVPLLGIEAQSDVPYSVSLRRDFGYGNGADIQGKMTLSLKGDESQIKRVVFLIDGKEMAVLTQPPFKTSFSTDTYAIGQHELSAEVETVQGEVYDTRGLTYNFIGSDQVGKSMQKILLPVFGVIAASLLISYLVGKPKKSGNEPGQISYGAMWGGAICKACGLPFSRSPFGMNMVIGRLERCPHCGKWQFTQRTSTERLAEAEKGLLKKVELPQETPVGSDQGQDLLDDTRYIDKL